ncbi:MAG: HAD hydrolase-like protein, partial [Clostridia bacterium]|nr:HAD hydrolase-like protein [Clostridia bacterium]
MYTHILFDLDGTITDPGLGITNSVMYSLRTYGIEITDRESLYPFIGPPLDESFMRYFGFRKEDCPEAIRRYREYFSDRGLFENEIYPGVSKMLSELKKAGKKIILATSKPEVFAERILEHFDLREYFDLVAGSTLDGSRIK